MVELLEGESGRRRHALLLDAGKKLALSPKDLLIAEYGRTVPDSSKRGICAKSEGRGYHAEYMFDA
jgi:hypothetical protein